MDGTLYQAAALILPLIFAIVCHEVAHGWVARVLGDPTAEKAGRLTLNPLRHVDPIGTIVLPGVLALMHAPVFGWAKPVPVNKWRLRNPRFGMMAVAIAGPGSNLLLALLGAVLLGLAISALTADSANAAGLFDLLRRGAVPDPSTGPGFVLFALMSFIMINIFLALFNLLPIPPFDGSHVVEGLLPRSWAKGYERLRPLGFPLVLILLIVLPWLIPGFDPVGRLVLPPVQWLTGHYLGFAGRFAS